MAQYKAYSARETTTLTEAVSMAANTYASFYGTHIPKLPRCNTESNVRSALAAIAVTLRVKEVKLRVLSATDGDKEAQTAGYEVVAGKGKEFSSSDITAFKSPKGATRDMPNGSFPKTTVVFAVRSDEGLELSEGKMQEGVGPGMWRDMDALSRDWVDAAKGMPYDIFSRDLIHKLEEGSNSGGVRVERVAEDIGNVLDGSSPEPSRVPSLVPDAST